MKNEIKDNISLKSCKALCQAKYVSFYENSLLLLFDCLFFLRLENEDLIGLEFSEAGAWQ